MPQSPRNIFKKLKVIELASVLAGPSVGMFFAELGATVIKVENKNTGGDITRNWRLPSENNPNKISAYYASVNWKKKSLFLNLKNSEGKQRLYRLIKDADIVITNQSTLKLKKLHIDYNTFKKINPLLIHANITGYGENNPKPAFDIVLQAETGFMSMNGTKQSGPLKMPVALIDVLAAHQLKEAILIALIQKNKTGKGAYVSVSLYDAAVSSLVNQSSNYLMANYLPSLSGSLHPNIAPYGETFLTRDNKYVVLAIGNDEQFVRMCNALGVPELANKKMFQTNTQRVKNRALLFNVLKPIFKKISSARILNTLAKHDVPIGLCKNLREVLQEANVEKSLLVDKKGGKRLKSVAFVIKKA